MKCGSLVLATDQGLGVMALDFFRNGIVTHPILVQHGSRVNHYEWYPPTTHRHENNTTRSYILNSGIDTIIFFETPFDWVLIPFCKLHGIRTAIMPMHECMPKSWPFQPDVVLNPSALEQMLYPHGTFIPVPVSRPWKLRTKAEVFVHNAGNGGLLGRNGTAELIEAIALVKSDAKFIIRSQSPLIPVLEREIALLSANHDIDYRVGSIEWDHLYSEGDVFVFPEKFNGLSLPLQEAYASGMAVMCGARFPMTEWLPHKIMIPTDRYNRRSINPAFQEFDEAVILPSDIALHIDEWYGKDISHLSHRGKVWAEQTSWDVLKPRYLEALSK